MNNATIILLLTKLFFMDIALSARNYGEQKVNRNPDAYEHGGEPTRENIYSLSPMIRWDPAVEEIVAIVGGGLDYEQRSASAISLIP